MNTTKAQVKRRNQEARDLLQLLELGYVRRPWTPIREGFSSELRRTTSEHLKNIRELQQRLGSDVAGVEPFENDPRILPSAIRGLAYLLHYQADDLFQHANKLEKESRQP